jgi:predicted RNA-binding Zn-ribbon protein involved in translation (DUF1610 family)
LPCPCCNHPMTGNRAPTHLAVPLISSQIPCSVLPTRNVAAKGDFAAAVRIFSSCTRGRSRRSAAARCWLRDRAGAIRVTPRPPRAPAVQTVRRPGPLKPRAITDRTCQPLAHNCRMSTITQTTVVFSCPKCGLNYQATQEHSSDQSSGSFDCKNCKTNVLKWSGVYDYSRWTPVPK